MLLKLINALKKPFSHPSLNQVIFFITSSCNLKCRNCFNWKNLNKKGDLSLLEITNISNNLPNFPVLLISGGEPFLRKDLPELISIFRKNNNINFVGIPTNGTLGNEVIKKTKEILIINPGLSVNLYFSIDGMENFQDFSRGVKNSFIKNINTLKQASILKKSYKNLTISINTVISSENISEIRKLMNYISNQESGFVDGHYFEIVRGLPKNSSVKDLNVDELKILYHEILSYQKNIYKSRKSYLSKLMSLFAIANLRLIYKLQINIFSKKEKWPMPCLAGKSIIVIDSDGGLRSCELRKPLINLKKIQFNINKYMKSKNWANELNRINKEKCDCTHACFLTESMYKSPTIIFKELPLSMVKVIKENILNKN